MAQEPDRRYHFIPEEHRGAGFALLASTSTLGNAAAPLISGLLAKHFSIPSVFVFDAVVYALMLGFVYRNVSALPNGEGFLDQTI